MENQKLKEEISGLQRDLRKANEAIKNLRQEIERKNVDLKRVDKLKPEVVSKIFHDSNTQISVIVGGVDVLLRGSAGDLTEQQIKFLNLIKDASDRLKKFLRKILLDTPK